MEADDISKLVELTDSLVYSKTGQHLEPVEKEILCQTLTGNKNTDIKFPNLRNSYVQRRCAPALWKQLSGVIGQKVNKRNVLKVLNSIHLQRRQLAAVTQSKCTANAQIYDLKEHAEQKGFVSYDQVNLSTKFDDNCQSDHEEHDCQQCNTQRRPTEQHRNEQQSEQSERSQTDHVQHKTASDSSPDSTSQKLHQFANTSSHENVDTKSSIYGLPSFINFKQPGVPLLLSIGVFTCSFGLSKLANWYGLTHHSQGKLPQAQLAYTTALKLNPFSAEAHYNFGVAQEDEQNYDRALTEYQMAIDGGLIEAYNNQARLYILQGKYNAAVSLLKIGLPLAKNEWKQTKYSFLKNLGWARLEQGYLEQAKVYLSQAIKLESEQAPAYCLLAELLERQGMKKKAILEWENCLRFSYGQLPEEDKWMHTAQQRLKTVSSQK